MDTKNDLTTHTSPPASVKMVALDIDGTLLNPEGMITIRTAEAIRALRRAGIVVTLATARRYYNTLPVAEKLESALPLIVYDGAMIVDYPAGEILHTFPLQAAIGQEAVNILVRHAIQPVVHPSTGILEQFWTGPASFDNLWIEAYFTTSPEQMRRLPYVELCAGHPDPLRVVAFASAEKINAVIPEISALDCSWNALQRGSYGTAELVVMRRGCSKALGVATVAERYGIALENVMAIGDNTNDVEMLKTVGWGVAMGQAPEVVKAAAHALTSSNREDGVAEAIERYILR